MKLIRVSCYKNITIKVEAVTLFKFLYLSGLPVKALLINAWRNGLRTGEAVTGGKK